MASLEKSAADRKWMSVRVAAVLLRVVALLGLVYAANELFFLRRVEFLSGKGHWAVLAAFLVIWVGSLLAMVMAAMQPNWLVRVVWASIFAISTAASHAFFNAAGSELSIFDFISMWTARHEIGRAFDNFHAAGMTAIAWMIFTLIVFVSPPIPRGTIMRRYLHRLMWVPAVPMVVIAAIVLVKGGNSTSTKGLPVQFQPIALGLASSAKGIFTTAPKRMAVTWEPGTDRAIRNIVVLVDESIRADYIDWRPGNPYTPAMASHIDRFANFGQAASGGNCSAYSNALLRLGGERVNPVMSVKTNPTIWQYAKKAGFRTVYIDGQSGQIKSGKKIQNFMTFGEILDIDRMVTFDDIPQPELDFEVLDIINEELSGDAPVFIFANKNGAHFPYDAGYPADQAVFLPTVQMSVDATPEQRVVSYRNVIRWSVDGFFAKMLDQTDLSATAIVYTSDHGQKLSDRHTHCTSENPDPRQGLVPLLALTGNPELMKRFQSAAQLNHNRATHFAIAPTLYELMGYSVASIEEVYGPTLFHPQDGQVYFTSNDIFGLFRSDVFRNPIDLNANYLESYAFPEPAGTPDNSQAMQN
jgi:lipid A ethanolaminephosphotransferase